MTMIPTPTQIAESRRQMDEITIWAGEQRIALLETLIQKYATHVCMCEGVSYLEERWFNPEEPFTREEWTEIRRIAEETD